MIYTVPFTSKPRAQYRNLQLETNIEKLHALPSYRLLSFRDYAQLQRSATVYKKQCRKVLKKITVIINSSLKTRITIIYISKVVWITEINHN